MMNVRIRTFTLLCFVLILLMPWVFFVIAHFIDTRSFSLSQANGYTVQMIGAIAGLLLSFFIIGVQMRRLLLKPLEGMSLASRQIAEGDLDVYIPLSRISEIAEVREGFEAMVTGLQKSHRKQMELENNRRFVIAAVAHDLRTPLFALRGYLDGLEQGIARSPEQAAKYVSVCKEKSAQLDRLVEDLFTFTKMEYVEGNLSSETVDLHGVLQRSVDSLRPLAQKKNITIVSEDAGTEHCIIHGDAHLLERAMNNLMDNAVRHTPDDGKIIVRCYRDEQKLIFSVTDSGVGFSEEDLPHVFEPLYRGEQSRNRATGGSGLGLTISQTIVRRHGGELEASNHPRGGALLEGWLPIHSFNHEARVDR
ncbi:sensor histidine kinase [Paenibacillus sp. FSL W7-1287]|uniref:sensor histidine kinase n=1 Tax=Paenibacillus sp. FSL W7-1287 TaxID=2954538 RepID=UPI0030FAFB5D